MIYGVLTVKKSLVTRYGATHNLILMGFKNVRIVSSTKEKKKKIQVPSIPNDWPMVHDIYTWSS